jgi:hypothetical protein
VAAALNLERVVGVETVGDSLPRKLPRLTIAAAPEHDAREVQPVANDARCDHLAPGANLDIGRVSGEADLPD